MAETPQDSDDDAPAKSKKGLIFVGLGAVTAAGIAFGAVWMGMLDSFIGGGAPTVAEAEGETARQPVASGAFHALEPISVSIGEGGASRQVRIRIVLEVAEREVDAVAALGPRLQDGMLGYLRAVDPAMLEDPAALLNLRAHMLRRARLIAGDNAVTNLLVTDFVLS